MRPIDADSISDKIEQYIQTHMMKIGFEFGMMRAVDLIRIEPTIDAVQVVRCKDCMHWDKTWTNDWTPDRYYCPMIDRVCKGEFYCADAERNEDND